MLYACCAAGPRVARVGAGVLGVLGGIIDSHGLMLAYQGEAEDHGAMIAFNTAFVKGEAGGEGFDLALGDGEGGEYRLGARMLVNAAGLNAQDVGRALAGLAPCDQMFEMATSALGHGIGKARRPIFAERDTLDFDPTGLVMIGVTRESEVEARVLENRDLTIDLGVACEG